MRSGQIAIITAISLVVLVSISAVFSNPDAFEAFAGVTLSNENVAKSIQVRVNPVGTNFESVYDTFSRIGFV